jgi:hypothetical protein
LYSIGEFIDKCGEMVEFDINSEFEELGTLESEEKINLLI